MVSQRSLHRLAEAIYEELEADGFFDDDRPRKRAATRSRRGMRLPPRKKAKRRASKANTRYSKCFKKLKPRYMKKNGGWKKDGFARCVRASHKCARKGR